MPSQKYLDFAGLQRYDAKLKESLAHKTHSYTTAASAAKNWYRIANASTSPVNAAKPLHVQFRFRAYNSEAGVGYWQTWFVDAEVSGQTSGVHVFGESGAPFSQVRILYENTADFVTSSVRPAIDIYLNYVLSGETVIEIEELNNSGFDFVADGALSASTVPSGYENRAVGPYASGVSVCGNADYASRAALNRANFTANFTLSDSNTYRGNILNCTGTITVTAPSLNSAWAWFIVKNANTTSGTVTIHPSASTVLIDGISEDIVLQPKEYVLLQAKAANNYTVLMDGRWKSKKADKANTLAGYGITDAKIESGTITLGTATLTPLTSASTLNAAKLSGTIPSGCYTNTVYTHPDTSGSRHVPSGGSSGQFLGWDSDGTAKWVANPNSDTKNTAGSTDSSKKLYLVGAESQAANPQTYSHDTAYVGTDGCLYSGGTKVLTAHQDISGKADKATTLAGYGISDAKIASGTITLGSATITPLTSASTLDAAKLSGTIPSGCYTDTVYTHPTTAGNKHIPSGGSSGQFLKWSADGTAAWSADNNTTYAFASGDSNGQIKVTPSGGTAQNVSVTGLGSAAYTASTAYAAASHEQASNTITAMTGYAKASSAAAVDAADTLNEAVGKLEKALDAKADSASTLSGYGIADAKITSGTITLGSATITPLTAASTLDAAKLSGTIPAACYTNTVYTHPTTSGSRHVPSGGSSGQVLGWDSDGTAKWVSVSVADTKNTAGSTDTSSKIYLVGAESQDANPQTYSHDTAYVGTDGCLYSGGTKVLTAHQDISGKADKATTLAGYGITDAKIASGTITLGSATITPLTADSSLAASKITGQVAVGNGGTGLTSLDTFVRTTGNQTVGGTKTFSSEIMVNKGDKPAAGALSHILGVTFQNTGGTQTHTTHPISIIGNSNADNNYNSGVRLGSLNGTTVVSAGESGAVFSSTLNKYDDENLYLNADGDVSVYVRCANDMATYAGPITFSGTANASGGTTTVTATTFSGNATSATKATQDGSGNTITSTYVKKAGDTMTGNLIIAKDSANFYLKSTNVTKATAPSANYTPVAVEHQDSAGRRLWGVYYNYNTDKTSYVRLIVNKGTTTDNTWTGIGVGYDGSGNWFTYAPTPAAADNTTKIATTAFCKDFIKALSISGKTITYTKSTGTTGTITTQDTVYTHPTTAGNKHIPSGGSSGQFLKWSASGTATWAADNNTTYSAATESAAGLMSAADKKKLNGIATGATAGETWTKSSTALPFPSGNGDDVNYGAEKSYTCTKGKIILVQGAEYVSCTSGGVAIVQHVYISTATTIKFKAGRKTIGTSGNAYVWL